MPGVPSGRGCDACRKSKKKCDEVKPVCTRCTRRGIECVGAGETRYKFMDEDPTTVARKRSPKHHAKPTTSRRETSICVIAATPSNNVTLLSQALVAAMSPMTDLSYNLMWAYGGYLMQIPRRIGVNEALDTAVDALVTTHASFSSRKEINVTSYTKYSSTLRALRKCLDNRLKAGTSETLCAVSLLLLVQHMLGCTDLARTGHAEGAAKILKARKSFAPRDSFERMLLLALRGPVLFEGLYNRHIDLNPQEWKDLVENELDSGAPEGEMLQCLSRVPDFLHRVRINSDGLNGLFALQAEMKGYYRQIRDICDRFGAEVAAAETTGGLGACNPFGLPPVMLHAHYQRMYGITITVALYLNHILSALRTVDSSLAPDAEYLCFEMLNIAENAVIYRPFGAAYVPMGLIAGWVAVDNPDLRTVLEFWISEYNQDFNQPEYKAENLAQYHYISNPFRGISEKISEMVEDTTYKPSQIELQV